MAFDVWKTPIATQDYHRLRADVASQVDAAEEVLQRHGCKAADYRLAGKDSPLGRICDLHLDRDWRILLGFPAPSEVTMLIIGRHLRGPRSIYERLYRLLEVEEPPDERRKDPCCADDAPPVDLELVNRLIAVGKASRRA